MFLGRLVPGTILPKMSLFDPILHSPPFSYTDSQFLLLGPFQHESKVYSIG